MALLGIADYDSSSSNSDSETDDDHLYVTEFQMKPAVLIGKLPVPDLDGKEDGKVAKFPGSDSIFHNPYRKEKELNIDTLSRHVLPTEIKETHKTMHGTNEVKVCRKFAMKGKCRFGDKCKFVHSTAQHQQERKRTRENCTQSEKMLEKQRTMLIGDLDGLFDDDNDDDDDGEDIIKKKRKKRPGLANCLIPSKKAVEMYNSLNKA